MRKFEMFRGADASGVSGIGHVLDGVIFRNGKVVVTWLSTWTSVSVYESFRDFWQIHCSAHPNNRTEVHFEDGTVITDYEQAAAYTQ